MASNQICLHQQAYCCLVIGIGGRRSSQWAGATTLRRSDHHLRYISVYYAAAECIMSAYNRYRVPLCGPRTSVGTGKHRDRMQRLRNSPPRQFIPLLSPFPYANAYYALPTATAILSFPNWIIRNELFSLFLSIVCLFVITVQIGIAIVRHLRFPFQRSFKTHSRR